MKNFYVYWIVVWLIIWMPMRYWSPVRVTRNTYQLPSAACTNTLISDLDTFEAVREGLFVLFILVPFSVCYMLWSETRRLHIVVSFLALIWAVVMFACDINDIAYANAPPNDPYFKITNFARDNRWCLYWGGQPGTALLCANNGPCMGSPVDPQTFGINGPFLTRFVFNILLILMISLNLWLMRQENPPVVVEKNIRYKIKNEH
jgi:hypothetical protein